MSLARRTMLVPAGSGPQKNRKAPVSAAPMSALRGLFVPTGAVGGVAADGDELAPAPGYLSRAVAGKHQHGARRATVSITDAMAQIEAPNRRFL